MLYFVCFKFGVIFLFFNIVYILDEVGYFVEDVCLCLFVCDLVSEIVLRLIISWIGVVLLIFGWDGCGSFVDCVVIVIFWIVVIFCSFEDFVCFLYMFGIIGCFKGVMLI